MNTRQIKFKLWSKRDGWCGGFSVHQSGLVSTIINAHIEEPQHIAVADAHWEDLSKQDDLILLQYTGLKDMNDKEIFEGDIVKWHGFGNGGKDTIKEVKFVNTYSRSGWNILSPRSKQGSTPENRLEIIGNIYESPNLLFPNN